MNRASLGGSSRRPGYGGRIARLVELLGPGKDFDWSLELPSGEIVRPHPDAVPLTRCEFVLHDWSLLRGPVNQLTLVRAYIRGDLDINVIGDPAKVFDLRDRTADGMTPWQAARLAGELALRAPVRANRDAIRRDYDTDHFPLCFLDDEHHLYSTLIFDGDADRSLEAAARAKLARMHRALGLKAGDHILDIGGGWGGLTRYCAPRGIDVTTLTLTEASADYIRDVIRQTGGRGEVLVQDLLEHRAWQRYDHVVIFGVIEHIPTYAAFCERVWDAVRPRGKVYADASATWMKYAGSAVTREFTWTGPHSCLKASQLMDEFGYHGFSVEPRTETRDYELTMRKWAQRLDDKRDAIVREWGQDLYRTYRVFLWGGTHAFATERLQAYSLVATRTERRGVRPGRLRRAAQAFAQVRAN